MRTAEQFVYYLIALALLLQQCSSMLYLMHVYIDFACQLKITWARYAAVLHLDTERMRLMVNWMHGASHNMACQLKNNGRYLEGSAHRVGGADRAALEPAEGVTIYKCGPLTCMRYIVIHVLHWYACSP
ncbi:hypothetical protein V8C86DRAFT_2996333 [Haematococcus lacustris]